MPRRSGLNALPNAIAAATLLVVASAPCAGQPITLATSPKGIVYWYGHRLEAPYSVTWDSAGSTMSINGFPLTHLKRPPQPVDTAAIVRLFGDVPYSDKNALTTLAAKSTLHAGPISHSGRPEAERMLEVFLSRPDLVDSARVIGGGVRVFWRGAKIPEGISVPSRAVPTPPHLAASILATTWTQILRSGGMVVFGSGGVLMFWPRENAEVQASIDSLARGQAVCHPLLRSASVAADFRLAKAMEVILKSLR